MKKGTKLLWKLFLVLGFGTFGGTALMYIAVPAFYMFLMPNYLGFTFWDWVEFCSLGAPIFGILIGFMCASLFVQHNKKRQLQ